LVAVADGAGSGGLGQVADAVVRLYRQGRDCRDPVQDGLFVVRAPLGEKVEVDGRAAGVRGRHQHPALRMKSPACPVSDNRARNRSST
jgi:hypothetical protein